MAVKFEDGTRVQLKSGGPIMTVESYEEASQRYVCLWFTNGKHNRESFKESSIDKYEPGVGIY